MEENKDLNVETGTMSNTNTPMEAPMADTTNNTVTPPIAEVVEPTPEPEPEQEGNGDTITFDYNQLYQNNAEAQMQEQPAETQPSEDIQETPIALESEQTVQPDPVVKDIVPTFDTSALVDDLPDELKPKTEETLIHTVATESQKEKKESRQNILFIVILFAVLIVAVLVIFPKMLGLN